MPTRTLRPDDPDYEEEMDRLDSEGRLPSGVSATHRAMKSLKAAERKKRADEEKKRHEEALARLPKAPEWFTTVGLYSKKSLIGLKPMFKSQYLNSILGASGIESFTTYCPRCKSDTVAVREEAKDLRSPAGSNQGFTSNPLSDFTIKYEESYEVVFRCAHGHCPQEMFYEFYCDEGSLVKMGQYPSYADLSSELKEYDKVITEDQRGYWRRAIGLNSADIGIGSYVYLRRILEDFINEAAEEMKKVSGWDEDEYRRGRMREKIDMLKDGLPEFIVENKVMYSLLSKGIHRMSENECKASFQLLHEALCVICDERVMARAKRLRSERVSKAMSEAAKDDRE